MEKDSSDKNPEVKSEIKEEKGEKELPAINFTTFVLSLASSAQVHLGLVPNPATQKTDASLPLAKQTIDILELLQEKTKGNLDEGEGKILEQLLFELRMQYVESKGKENK